MEPDALCVFTCHLFWLRIKPPLVGGDANPWKKRRNTLMAPKNTPVNHHPADAAFPCDCHNGKDTGTGTGNGASIALMGRSKPGFGTQLTSAVKGEITPEMEYVAKVEGLDAKFVMERIAAGRMVIPANVWHTSLKPAGIGVDCKCKVNANIGSSHVASSIEREVSKLEISLKYGADAVMDLSTGSDLVQTRCGIIAASPAPVGTVPIYEMAESVDEIEELDPAKMLEIIEAQARQGVDFMTIHAGLLREHLPMALGRVTGIVSRGGALMTRWMLKRKRQNPLYEYFDDICDIFRAHDVTFSLGDGLRPGSLADASDAAQFAELDVLGELTRRAKQMGVQVMVEGPGHIPFDQIDMNVRRQEEVCDGAPFYVLGPIVTDISPGYDHITSAIGATMAAYCGAAMLCYVTPREHLGLPNGEDVRNGLIAFRIAAHAADVARHRVGVRDRDDAMARARASFNWKEQFRLALDPERAESMFQEAHIEAAPAADHGDADGNVSEDAGAASDGCGRDGVGESVCTMCGPKFCAMRITRDVKSSL